MTTFNVEADVYIGYSGSAITALDGNSGTALANVQARQLRASIGASLMNKRHGRGHDDVASYTMGMEVPEIALQLRDVSEDTKRLLWLSLCGVDGGVVGSSGTDVETVGQLSATIQIWVKRVSGAANIELYAPACAVSPTQRAHIVTWERFESFYSQTELILRCTKLPTQTTPAMLTGTNAQLAGVYFA